MPAEAGVRFIEVEAGYNNNWDIAHNGLTAARVPQLCRQIDQPMAGLLADSRQRGLLEDIIGHVGR